MSDLKEEHYSVDDIILPALALPATCEIRIDIDESGVTLHVGPRDWHWKRGCPDIDGCGTELCSAFDPGDLPSAEELKEFQSGINDIAQGRTRPLEDIAQKSPSSPRKRWKD